MTDLPQPLTPARMSYAEQLAHPQWQRRRLEMLNAASWACRYCGDIDSQLHVHHRQYFKGRMAWEYADQELVVLCEACHKSSHECGDGIKQILATTPEKIAFAVLAGLFTHPDTDSMPDVVKHAHRNFLALARSLHGVQPSQKNIAAIREFCDQIKAGDGQKAPK